MKGIAKALIDIKIVDAELMALLHKDANKASDALGAVRAVKTQAPRTPTGQLQQQSQETPVPKTPTGRVQQPYQTLEMGGQNQFRSPQAPSNKKQTNHIERPVPNYYLTHLKELKKRNLKLEAENEALKNLVQNIKNKSADAEMLIKEFEKQKSNKENSEMAIEVASELVNKVFKEIEMTIS